jgi:hypothetical protein
MSQWDTLRGNFPRLYKKPIAFECGPGWYDILYSLSTKIERILEDIAKSYERTEGKENELFHMYAVQVKEKYGTLRFYMLRETDEISDLIEDAEALSSQTCENCGAPGKMRGACWMEVRCDQCFKEKK